MCNSEDACRMWRSTLACSTGVSVSTKTAPCVLRGGSRSQTREVERARKSRKGRRRMAPEYCSRIVRTRPGQMTGETVYVTEDGHQWTSDSFTSWAPSMTTNGPSLGYINGDSICSSPHEAK